MPKRNLTPEEDAELRRLHLLKSFGAVAGSISSRYNALKGRDRRKTVREPDETSIAQPITKSPWVEQALQTVVPAENPAPDPVELDDPIPPPRVDPTRERSDTLRVIAEQPDRKGLFRR
jgi:hypothetical protein